MQNFFQNPDEMMEQGVSLVKKTSDQVVKQVQKTGKMATSQLTGTASVQQQPGVNNQLQQDEQVQEFVQDLYGRSKPQTNSQQSAQLQAKVNPNAPEEDQAKQLEKARKELAALQNQHKQVYYDPTFNPQRKQPEEKKADELERKKQEEMIDLQKKEEKKLPPLAVRMQQQRAEKFPGASG